MQHKHRATAGPDASVTRNPVFRMILIRSRCADRRQPYAANVMVRTDNGHRFELRP